MSTSQSKRPGLPTATSCPSFDHVGHRNRTFNPFFWHHIHDWGCFLNQRSMACYATMGNGLLLHRERRTRKSRRRLWQGRWWNGSTAWTRSHDQRTNSRREPQENRGGRAGQPLGISHGRLSVRVGREGCAREHARGVPLPKEKGRLQRNPTGAVVTIVKATKLSNP